MSEIRTVFVDVKILMPKKLQKDLHENEMLCPVCHGLGLIKRTMEFGMNGYRDPQGRAFPFKHQNMQECHNCYNGVVTFCKYCGHPNRDKRNIAAETNCQCEAARADRDKIYHQAELERWKKADKISLKEAIKRFEMLYVEEHEEYVNTDELEDWIEQKQEEIENFDKYQLHIYGTYTSEIGFDASDIVAEACGDLHEDAGDNISSDEISELQEFMDAWAEKYGQGTKTYWADDKVGILV